MEYGLDLMLAIATILVSFFGFLFVMRRGRVNAASGILVGLVIFICGPISQFLIFGGIADEDLPLPAIVLGAASQVLLFILLCTMALTCISVYYAVKVDRPIRQMSDGSAKAYFRLYCFAYLAFGALIFFLSGKQDGGHWMGNNHEMYSQGFFSSIVGNFYNVVRVTFPGVVLFAFRRGVVKYSAALAVLFVFCGIELIISSNRIIVLFSMVAALIISWRLYKSRIAIGILLLPVLLQANAIFPVVRGLMWADGLSSQQFSYAISAAHEARAERATLEKAMNSAFESSNLQVIQYSVNEFTHSNGLLLGETMLLKPVTFFLPRAIFPEKPEGFNTRVGYAATGNKVLSLNATLVGEAYGNFAWFSPVVMVLFLAPYYYLARRYYWDIGSYQFFFISLAAWRFEYSFIVISLFVIATLNFVAKHLMGVGKR